MPLHGMLAGSSGKGSQGPTKEEQCWAESSQAVALNRAGGCGRKNLASVLVSFIILHPFIDTHLV